MDMMDPSGDRCRTLALLERVDLHLPFIGGSSNSKEGVARVGGTIARTARRPYVAALRDIDLTVASGDKIAVLGHNGAGKTSLLRVISGIYSPTRGNCTITGRVSALLSSTVGMSTQNTGRANIRQACAMFDVPRASMAAFEKDVITFSELGDYIDLPVSAYSAGMRIRLGFSIVSGLDPEILVIDEVLSAGDMAFAQKAQARIVAMIDRSHALIVSSHSASLMRMFCNRALWLERGEIRMDGAFDDVWGAYYEDVAARKG